MINGIGHTFSVEMLDNKMELAYKFTFTSQTDKRLLWHTNLC
ncbi:hypothetical protein ES703_66790 [subsurface metagenome]